MFYSATQNAWFDPAFREDYEANGSWPADAKEYPRATFDAVVSYRPTDKVMAPDAQGNPVLIDIPGPSLADAMASTVRRIDADADAIYVAALGNRATEYTQAEADAQAFKAAGYTGAVPAYVQAWAVATGNPAQWAADDILATATAWRTAQSEIRANRLTKKQAARNAADLAALSVVASEWEAFVVAMRAQLALV